MSTIFTCVYVSVHVDVSDHQKAEIFAKALEDGNVDKLRRYATLYPTTLPSHHSLINRIRLPALMRRGFAELWRFTAQTQCRRVLWMLFNVFAPELVVFVAILELSSARSAAVFMRRHVCTRWSLQLAFFADMGGFQLEDGTVFHNGLEFMRWVLAEDISFVK